MSEIIFSLFVDPESLNMQLIRFNQTIAYSMILCIINTSPSSTSKHFNKDSTLYDIINAINSLIIINFISSLIIIFLFPFIWHYTARIWNSKTAYRFSQCLHPTMHFSSPHSLQLLWTDISSKKTSITRFATARLLNDNCHPIWFWPIIKTSSRNWCSPKKLQVSFIRWFNDLTKFLPQSQLLQHVISVCTADYSSSFLVLVILIHIQTFLLNSGRRWQTISQYLKLARVIHCMQKVNDRISC